MRILLTCTIIFLSVIQAGGQVVINDYTVWGSPGGTTTFNPTGSLTVNDTLIIYGNLYLDLDEDLVINNDGVLIVFGDFDAKNKVDLGLGGYFIVTGDFNKNGGQGDIEDNGGSMFLFDDTPEWGAGNTPPDVFYGDEDDIVDDPIFDFFEDLLNTVCNITISNVTITNASCEGVTDGSINITITGVVNPPPTIVWSNGAVTEDISALTAGEYSVYIYKGFCFARDTFTITANPLPGAAGTISGSSSTCTGSSEAYTVPAIANATSYTWTASNGATGSSSTNSITFSFPNPGTSTITVYGVNSCGNGTSSTLNVSVSESPNASILSGNVSTCAGNSDEVYSVTNNASWTYAWSIEDNVGTIQAPGNTSSITVDWKSSSELFVGPFASVSSMVRKVTVTVNTNPVNSCPKVLEWNVTINRLPVTGAQYHLDNL